MAFRLGIIRLSALGDVIISASFLGFLGEIKRRLLESNVVEISDFSNKDSINSSSDFAAKDSIESSSNFSESSSEKGLKIEWFVDKRFSEILENSPVIDRLHALDFKGSLRSFKGLFSLRKYMKNCGRFDVVIDMQGLVKSSLVGKMLDSRHFVGFSWRGAREGAASFFYSTRVNISYHANILQRNFALIIESLRLLGLDSMLDSMDKTLQNCVNSKVLSHAINLRKNGFSFDETKINSALKSKIDSKNFKILFVLEASIKEKIYPAKSFVELAKMIEKYKKATFFIAFKDNKNAANIIESNLQNTQRLQNLSFNELKFALSNMDCAIGGDTGLTYLAWALGCATITLYGNKNASNLQNTSAQDSSDTKIDSKNAENMESNLQDSKDLSKNFTESSIENNAKNSTKSSTNIAAKFSTKKSSKNMRNTDLSRILLGNPYIVSNSDNFEIESISPNEIFKVFKTQIL